MSDTVETTLDAYSEMDVDVLLETAGIPRRSGSYRDYERAKEIVFGGKWWDDFSYARLLVRIVSYLGI